MVTGNVFDALDLIELRSEDARIFPSRCWFLLVSIWYSTLKLQVPLQLQTESALSFAGKSDCEAQLEGI